MKNYQFQPETDWFTKNLQYWEKHLLPLKGLPNMHFLEIGSFEGRSSVWLLDTILTSPTSSLTCIDAFEEPPSDYFDNKLIEPNFYHNIKESGAESKMQIIKGFSNKILPTLIPETYDFIEIDASHKAKDVLDDAVFSWRLLKKGGLLFFDDYEYTEGNSEIDRPKMAIDAFLSVRPTDYRILDHQYQMYIQKRR